MIARKRAARPLPPFAEWLRRLRKEQGLSQQNLAETLAVSQQTISLWERGLRKPSRRMEILLKHQLGITQEELEGRRSQGAASSQVAEARVLGRGISLPAIPKDAAAMRVEFEGLASEALGVPEAQRALKEALRAGRPLWIVLGPVPK